MKYDFYDHVKIHVKAGKGGDGAISFHREKYISHGGPDGGDGGHGGNIIFKVDSNIDTLIDFKINRIFKAENGKNGTGDKFHGANGEDLVILVPPGTIIKDYETGKVIKDLSDCPEFIGAKGGRGGWGNRHFATATRQAPHFAKTGLDGEEKDLVLELKMLADVGFVGMPSVGKSTLLSTISQARPKIAAYHFTTLFPMLGVVRVENEGKGFVAADIPGLIEGASSGLGLGFDFLRHVDRCRLIVHVIDIASTEGRDPIDDMEKINEELRLYNPELAKRPQIIAANKIDAIYDEDNSYKKELEAYCKKNSLDYYYISAATGEGTKELCYAIYEKLQTLPPIEIYESEYEEEERKTLIPTDIEVHKEKDMWIVEGLWLKKLMTGVNMDDYESISYFNLMLKNNGVYDKMKELGIEDGDEVSIYGLEFDMID